MIKTLGFLCVSEMRYDMNLTIELSNRIGYVPRTGENIAQSDCTIAIASDFMTAGERLTKKLCRLHNKPILQIPHNALNTPEYVDSIVWLLNQTYQIKQKPLVLNGAGNGVYTLASKSQAEADSYALRFLTDALKHPDKRFVVGLVRSGGQTGYDIAIIKAALSLNLPALIHCARSKDGKFMIRGANGKDFTLNKQEYIKFMNLEGEILCQT